MSIVVEPAQKPGKSDLRRRIARGGTRFEIFRQAVAFATRERSAAEPKRRADEKGRLDRQDRGQRRGGTFLVLRVADFVVNVMV